MKIFKELSELVNELSTNNSYGKQTAAKIKKYYKIYSQETKRVGKLREDSLDNISKILLNNYDKLYKYEAINETLELITYEVETPEVVEENTSEEVPSQTEE